MGGWVGDSQSQFALDNGSQHGELEVDEIQVEDASVRALRPRSSRRGSWESEASGWSAKVAMVRERSLKASSWKAGTLTDGDGSTELTGEEVEGSEGRGHGPSPLAATRFAPVDAVYISVEEEGRTPPAKEGPEIKFVQEYEPQVETKDEVNMVPSSPPEHERTPTKKPLVEGDGADSVEEEMAQKIPAGEASVMDTETSSTMADEAKAAT
jgi:hypothetical protein